MLLGAVAQAELAEALAGEGPFTVFAPTNDAFAALPEGTVEGLLEDIPALTDVLLYHVVPGKVMAADVVNLDSADTVLGQPVSISVTDGNGGVHAFEYEDHLLTTLTDPEGILYLENVYNGEGQVIEQFDASERSSARI